MAKVTYYEQNAEMSFFDHGSSRSEDFRVIKFGLDALTDHANEDHATWSMLHLLSQNKRMVFTKVSDDSTHELYQAYEKAHLFYRALIYLKYLVREKGRETIASRIGLSFQNVAIEKMNPRIFINNTTTSIDTVWIVADDTEIIYPFTNILKDMGYHR